MPFFIELLCMFDLVTDIIFTYSLRNHKNESLFICSIIFTTFGAISDIMKALLKLDLMCYGRIIRDRCCNNINNNVENDEEDDKSDFVRNRVTALIWKNGIPATIAAYTILLEDIPQFIVEIIIITDAGDNNTSTSEIIAYISMGFSLLSVIFRYFKANNKINKMFADSRFQTRKMFVCCSALMCTQCKALQTM